MSPLKETRWIVLGYKHDTYEVVMIGQPDTYPEKLKIVNDAKIKGFNQTFGFIRMVQVEPGLGSEVYLKKNKPEQKVEPNVSKEDVKIETSEIKTEKKRPQNKFV